jgi:uncharacterized membrane protein YfcA
MVVIAVIGLAAGAVGGMLGVGGSIVMIPALTAALGPSQHLYQAAAMIVNVAVVLPAARRHYQAGAVVGRAVRWMLPAAVLCVLLGGALSNLPLFLGEGTAVWLRRLFALFLLYVAVLNLGRLLASSDRESMGEARVTPARGIGAGSIMGTVAGLLGIGGGSIALPLQQVWLRLPLRQCIANATVVIVFSASAGAIYKNLTLLGHGHGPTDGLILALALGPTAWVGGYFGAALTHRLALRWVRGALLVMLLAAAWEMAALPLNPF